MSDVRIEKGLVISRRRVLELNPSTRAITLPAEWWKIQKWLGRELTEVCLVANQAIVVVPPDEEEKAKKILLQLEQELKKA